MHLTIQSQDNPRLLDYRVELLATPQPFYHTATQIMGNFGRIMITKIDLRCCTIWMADYNITEPVSLRGFVNERLYQVYFPVPTSFPNFSTLSATANDNTTTAELFLSATDTHTIQLPANYSRMLFIHYTRQYFDNSSSGGNGNLQGMFETVTAGNNLPVKINAAVINVISQIINASPANRIVHLYLEAKIKELLTLLYQLINPEDTLPLLSEKEIEALRQVQQIILSDLSRSYNSYELSKLVASNAYTLKKNFKAWFGIPLHLFLHNCRMEKATELLLHTQLSVKEIAFAEIGRAHV